jgi:hypothetical protein
LKILTQEFKALLIGAKSKPSTVDLGGKIYKLTPNGLASGLCDIVA